MSATVEAPFPHRDLLGESPYWDAASNTLVRVDSERGEIYRLNPRSGEQTTIAVRPRVGFALPASTGEIVIGENQALVAIGESGERRTLAAVDPAFDANNWNDAKCDSRGRLFGGTLDMSFTPGSAFYRFSKGGELDHVLSGITISNGLGWDNSRSLMYYVDSTTQRIDVFDYDLDTGIPSGRRPFVNIPEEVGMPDGLEVDAEGGVWLALFNGGSVRRFDSNGALSEVVTLPTSCPSSIAFGGPDLRTAFVTSSWSWLSEEQKKNEPLGGAVFMFDAGVAGQPTNMMAL